MAQTTPFQEQLEIGYPILEELFKLSDEELKEKLQPIIGSDLNDWNDGILKEGSSVRREIYNMKCEKITIIFYDWIEINSFGIYYHPEHGGKKKMVEFNNHFKL